MNPIQTAKLSLALLTLALTILAGNRAVASVSHALRSHAALAMSAGDR
jgi:ABC-type phosphate transport system permease subunit